jgi:structural maintenance of chromosome 1
VTLDGTVIHKSGLITGGRSTRDTTKKWDDTDVKGMSIWVHSRPLSEKIAPGLNRVKENLLAQLKELQNKKPKGKEDEALLLEIERLGSSLVVARDDLVGSRDPHTCLRSKSLPERCTTPQNWHTTGTATCRGPTE